MKIEAVQSLLKLGDFLGRKLFYNNREPYFVNVHKNITYSFKDTKQNVLDILIPEDVLTDFPVLIFIHGGGWISGTKDSYSKYCKMLASSGFVVINANYRLAPKSAFPNQIEDVFDVIRWTVANLKDFGCQQSLDYLFLSGDSAGAHLVSLASAILTNNTLQDHYKKYMKIPDVTIQGLALFYGVYNFNTVQGTGFPEIRTMTQGLLNNEHIYSSQWINFISPIDFVTPDYPPTFITAGEVDHLYPQTLEMINALKTNNIKSDILLFDKEKKDAGHSFLHYYGKKCTQTSLIRLLKFITIQYAFLNKDLAKEIPLDLPLKNIKF